MCTLVILRRPGHPWPLLLAANRDEMIGRPWLPPARHWPDRPDVVGGLDRLAGGTWLALNDLGVCAAVLNREGTLGPDAGKRSRGELVLDAVDHPDAAEAAAALARLDGSAFRSFNLIVADDRDAFWIRGVEAPEVGVESVPPGLSMIASRELNDTSHPRLRRYLPCFRDAPDPEPETGDWSAWAHLLAASSQEAGADPRDGMNISTDYGYGTVSSSLIALPAPDIEGTRPIWLFSAGRPGTDPFLPVEAVDRVP